MHRENWKIILSFTHPFFFQEKSSKEFRGEMMAKDLDAGLGNSQVFSTQYCF
jgi:hypothetical protein